MISHRVAMKYAERLIPLSGPEVREAAESMLDVVPGGSMSFEGLIELAYLKALAENDEHRAHSVASHFMSESDLQELRERIADKIQENRKMQHMKQQLGF